MSKATCRTCGAQGPPWEHKPSALDPDGVGDPGHKVDTTTNPQYLSLANSQREETMNTDIPSDSELRQKIAKLTENLDMDLIPPSMLMDEVMSLIKARESKMQEAWDGIKLTSDDWSKLIDNPSWCVLDPDGWDRKNFQYSWYEERITAQEFRERSMYSTLQMPKDDYPVDRLVEKYGAAQSQKGQVLKADHG